MGSTLTSVIFSLLFFFFLGSSPSWVITFWLSCMVSLFSLLFSLLSLLKLLSYSNRCICTGVFGPPLRLTLLLLCAQLFFSWLCVDSFWWVTLALNIISVLPCHSLRSSHLLVTLAQLRNC
jgi:hypothetical protein